MLPLLSSLSPDARVLLFTLGIALIAIELNRPGRVIPGALGLLAVLLAVAAILQHRPPVIALALLLSSAIVLLLPLRFDVTLWIVLLGAAAGTLALALLPGVHLAVAVSCGLGLSTGISVLSRIARRARQNKGLD